MLWYPASAVRLSIFSNLAYKLPLVDVSAFLIGRIADKRLYGVIESLTFPPVGVEAGHVNGYLSGSRAAFTHLIRTAEHSLVMILARIMELAVVIYDPASDVVMPSLDLEIIQSLWTKYLICDRIC